MRHIRTHPYMQGQNEMMGKEERKEGRKEGLFLLLLWQPHSCLSLLFFSTRARALRARSHTSMMHTHTHTHTHTHMQSPHLCKCRLDPTIPFPADFHRMHTHECYLHMPLRKKKVEHEVRKEKRRSERRSRDKTVWETLISFGSLFKCSPQALTTVV